MEELELKTGELAGRHNCDYHLEIVAVVQDASEGEGRPLVRGADSNGPEGLPRESSALLGLELCPGGICGSTIRFQGGHRPETPSHQVWSASATLTILHRC